MSARSAAVAALVGVTALGASGLAGLAPAAAGSGASTAVTEPSGSLVQRYDVGQPSPTLSVSGTASGTTSVDLDCLTGSGAETQLVTLAGAVPVSAGTFAATVDTASATALRTCRLRAVPTGTPTTDDLSAFTGPVLHLDTVQVISESGVAYGLQLFLGDADGVLQAQSAAFCPDAGFASLNGDLSTAGALHGCVAALPRADLAGTASTIRVDGHHAFLPFAVLHYSLGLTEPLATSVRVSASGTVTWSESATLLRCGRADTFPPTQSTCGSLVPTGVRFTRSASYVRGGHQVRLHDSYLSTDHTAHTIGLRYYAQFAGTGTGPVGYRFPGHGTAFRRSTRGEVVDGLGTRAGSFDIRSDLTAAGDDLGADTRAVTWSRAPARISFATDKSDELEMPYTLAVPAGRSADLEITDSERSFTPDADALAAVALAETMSAPRITSPQPGAVLPGRRTTVTGRLTAGANGLPVTVEVAGHRAAIHRTGATTATFRVRFRESLGRHSIRVVATDAAGNTRRTRVHVRNR